MQPRDPSSSTPGLEDRHSDAPLDDSQRDLVRQHLPVVGYLVAEILGRVPQHVQRDDLVSAGQLALVKAARAYDASTGVPVRSLRPHAHPRCAGRRAAGRGLGHPLGAQPSALHGPRRRPPRGRARPLAHATPSWRVSSRSTSPSVSSARTDLHRSVVVSLDQLVETTGSADEHLAPGMHQVDAGQYVVQAERIRYLTAAVQALPERLRVVVEQYFLGERPMAEIAAQLGVTESRVSQLRAEALTLLRDGMNAHLDPEKVAAPERPDGVVARRRSAYYAQVAAFAAVKVPAQRVGEPVTRLTGDVTLTA